MTPMIIELAGAPGAGKTTLVPHLVSALEGFGAQPVNLDSDEYLNKPPTLKKDFLRAAARNPLLAFRLRPLMTKSTTPVLRIAIRDRQARLLRHRPGLWLVDEGPLHRLLYMAAFSGWNGDIRCFARRIAKPDVVVFLSVDPADAVERCRTRQDGHIMRSVSESDAAKAVIRYERLARALLDTMGVAIVEVEASTRDVTQPIRAAVEALSI